MVGEGVGVVYLGADGEAGDSGLRKGELRGEPYPRGEGLYPVGMAIVATKFPRPCLGN